MTLVDGEESAVDDKATDRVNGARRNFVLGAVGSALVVLLGFVGRTVMVGYTDMEDIALNAVFLNFMALLSVVEGGLLTASMFRLYRPLATGAWQETGAWYRGTRRLYRFAAFGVLILGALTAPIVPWVVNDLGMPWEEVLVLYALAVANSAALCWWAESKALLMADQRSYVVVIVQVVQLALMTLLQAAALVLTGSFLLFLVFQFLGTVVWNLTCAVLVRRRYAAKMSGNGVPGKEVRELLGDLKNLFAYKLGAVGLSATDAILVAAIVSAPAAGLLSNFTLIVNSANAVLMQAFNGIAAAIGIHNVQSSRARRRAAFWALSAFGNWLFGLTCVCLAVTLQPFVAWWLGAEYVIDDWSVAALVFTLFVIGSNQIPSLYRSSLGIFRATRAVPWAALVLNIVLSLALGALWGMPGVLAATGVARMCTFSVVDPILVFSRSLGVGVYTYMVRLALMASATGVASLAALELSHRTAGSGLGSVLVAFGWSLLLGLTTLTPVLLMVPEVRRKASALARRA